MTSAKRIRGNLLGIGSSGLREACGPGLDSKHCQQLLEPGHNVEIIGRRRSVDIDGCERAKRDKVKVRRRPGDPDRIIQLSPSYHFHRPPALLILVNMAQADLKSRTRAKYLYFLDYRTRW